MLKTSPLSIMRLYQGPTLLLNQEYYFKNKNSIQLETCYSNSKLGFLWKYLDVQGYSIEPSFSWNFLDSKTEKLVSLFKVGAAFELSYQDLTQTDSFEVQIDPVPSSQNYTYSSTRLYYGPTAYIGVNSFFKNGFMYGVKMGFGLRFNRIETDLPWAAAEQRYFGDWTVPANYLYMKGTHLIPVFKLKLYIGFGFGKFKDS